MDWAVLMVSRKGVPNFSVSMFSSWNFAKPWATFVTRSSSSQKMNTTAPMAPLQFCRVQSRFAWSEQMGLMMSEALAADWQSI